MKITKKILVAIIAITTILVGCEDADIPQIDVEDSRAIAGFNTGDTETPRIIFNPAEDTNNTITIGVSTLSSSSRSVVLEIDEETSTLDPIYYEISTLNPVIEAGEFTTNITITTIGSEILPGASDFIALNLISVADAEILQESESNLEIGLDVQCPSVDLNLIPGSYTVTFSTFANFFGETDVTREIIEGPGANQFTIIDGTFITELSEDLIITVDPDSGAITAVDETKIASQVSFAPNNYAFNAGGRVLTCVGIIEVNLDFGGSLAGNPFSFDLIKQ